MKLDFTNASDAVQSYLAAALGYATTLGWMNIGACVLLIARLIVDFPPAYTAIKEYFNKPKEPK